MARSWPASYRDGDWVLKRHDATLLVMSGRKEKPRIDPSLAEFIERDKRYREAMARKQALQEPRQDGDEPKNVGKTGTNPGGDDAIVPAMPEQPGADQGNETMPGKKKSRRHSRRR